MQRWRRLVTANDELQVLQALVTNRKTRNRDGRFLVEGVRNMTAAVAGGWTVDLAIKPLGALLSAWATDLVHQAAPRDRLELGLDLFDGLTERTERPELLLVVRKRATAPDRIAVDERFLGVLVDRPVNPGNLGTIVRTADAMGASVVVVSGHGADLYDPRTVRAAAGSLLALPTAEVGGPPDVLRWLTSAPARPTVVVADEDGDAVLGDVPLVRPLLLVLGNETTRPSRAYREMADLVVRIPMTGSASSLNVAQAAAMFLYELDRQARRQRDAVIDRGLGEPQR